MRSKFSQRLAGLSIVFGCAALAGCVNPLANYEELTAKTAADLDIKVQHYVRETGQVDAVRRNQQKSAEVRAIAEGNDNRERLTDMGLTGDSRQTLVANLQSASNQYLADRQQLPAPAVALTMSAAPSMGEVVKALDQMSRKESAEDSAKALLDYAKEVTRDLKTDLAAKKAEKSISHATATPATVPKS